MLSWFLYAKSCVDAEIGSVQSTRRSALRNPINITTATKSCSHAGQAKRLCAKLLRAWRHRRHHQPSDVRSTPRTTPRTPADGLDAILGTDIRTSSHASRACTLTAGTPSSRLVPPVASQPSSSRQRAPMARSRHVRCSVTTSTTTAREPSSTPWRRSLCPSMRSSCGRVRPCLANPPCCARRDHHTDPRHPSVAPRQPRSARRAPAHAR